MYVVVGLGNPGKKYFNTRHNIGFRVIDFLQSKYSVISTQKRKTYYTLEIEINNSKIYIIKTRVFMNESGIPVKKILEDFHIKSEELFIVYDDIHIPFGKIRIRKNGSSGGHNGINSIIEELKTTTFPRIKIGTGNENISDLVNYVLSEFTKEEKPYIPAIIEKTAMAIEDIIKQGIDKAMAKYNG
jgi:PTH1 family peptidyl-tRNA hydrolase